MFVMPLLNLPLLRSWLSRALRAILGALGLAHHGDGADGDNESEGDSGSVTSGCVVCAADPIAVPYAASCGHLYCYTCLAGSRLAEPSARFRCPRCDSAVTEIARARPEQLASKRSSSLSSSSMQ